jgi:hypothetical protein
MPASVTDGPSGYEHLAGEAAQRGDWSTAEQCWRECIATFESQAKSDWYLGHAIALSRLDRLDEADNVYAALRSRWPTKPVGWTEGARNAVARKDWPLAARLWRECISQFGGQGLANWWSGLAEALMQQKLYDEVDEVCRAAQARFPDASFSWEYAARIAATREAWVECGKAWEAAADRQPPESTFSSLQYGIRAFITAGSFDDAARLRAKQTPRTSAAKQTWLYTGFDLLMAQSNFRGALDFWDAHAKPFEIAQAATPTQMAKSAFEAELEPSQAIEALTKWLPRNDAVRAVDGIYAPARVALAGTRVDRHVRSVLRLRALRLTRRWPDYYQELSDLVESYWVPAGLTCLNAIAACPDESVRTTFLARLRNRLEEISPELSGPQAETYLGLLHRGRLPEKLAVAYGQLRERLSAPAAEYFRRAIAGEAERRSPSILGLGLSKTGTQSQHNYLERLGLLSAHWSNPLTGHILEEDDPDLFDAVNDVPVTMLAMKNGVDPERRIIVTTREFESWERSIMAHFAQYFDRRNPSFGRYKEEFYSGEQFGFGRPWYEMNHELYFRYESLREGYDRHRDWIADLEKRMVAPMLHLPLEAEDKAERLSRYLGNEFPVLAYPRVNVSRKSADGVAFT